MQTAIVVAIVAVALAYLVWRRIRTTKGETPSCGCGCSGCPSSGGCGESAPDVLRPGGGAAGGE
jgi:hypothetical protein